MIRISKEQYRALNEDAIALWHERLAALLRELTDKARAMSDRDLLALIKRQEARAAKLGVETERGIARWCFMAIVAGEKFDQERSIASFLGDARNGPPEERVGKLLSTHSRFNAEGAA
jgi:hypothetical protein